MQILDPTSKIWLYSIIWVAVVVIGLQATVVSRHRTVGLPLALLLLATLMHGGAVVYLFDGYNHAENPYLASWNYTRETVALGLEASTLGMFGYLVGILVANAASRRNSEMGAVKLPEIAASAQVLIVVGLVATAVALLFRQSLDALTGSTAIISGARQALTFGVCLALLYSALLHRRKVLVATFLGAIIVFPLIEMFTSGILGDSVGTALIVVSFGFALLKPSASTTLRAVIGLMVVGYALLMASIVWLETRDQIREVVWNSSTVSDRVGGTRDAIRDARVFGEGSSPLTYFDTRMNHNVIVGKAIETVSGNPEMRQNGRTLLFATIGWVPRAIWKDKPTRGGSDVVEAFVGKEMSRSSSFGTGQFFEFYTNFGYLGIFFGCSVYGWAIRKLDIRSARIFDGADVMSAAPYFVAGAALVTVFQSMFFILNGAVSGALVALAISYVAGQIGARGSKSRQTKVEGRNRHRRGV